MLADSHGDIVGDDRLLLELKLLEDVGLEDFFNLCMARAQVNRLPRSWRRSRESAEPMGMHSRKFQKL